MKILNIHGYKGNSANSAYSALHELGYRTISPAIDYDHTETDEIFGFLENIISEQKPDAVVGTSLGGFFAAVLSAEYSIPAILVNPCLMPFVTLPRLGFEGDIMPFVKEFSKLHKISTDNVYAITGKCDEIIDYHDFTKKMFENKYYREILNGKHSGATLPLNEYFSQIFQVITKNMV